MRCCTRRARSARRISARPVARRRCAHLEQALRGITALDRTPVPHVRAIVPRAEEFVVGGVPTVPALPSWAPDPASIRAAPLTSWNPRPARPTIDPTAYLDPQATVIGAVTVGAHVYIGPGVSIRADEGAPFFLGAESNLQDGVTLHALKGKVVLVEGRPFAIYVGRHTSLTHHALIHGPCFLGDHCFIGFRAMVHDAVIGAGCVLGLGAVVVGVTVPPGRFIGHSQVIDTQEKADALPDIPPDWKRLREDILEVNHELAAGHRKLTATAEQPVSSVS